MPEIEWPFGCNSKTNERFSDVVWFLYLWNFCHRLFLIICCKQELCWKCFVSLTSPPSFLWCNSLCIICQTQGFIICSGLILKPFKTLTSSTVWIKHQHAKCSEKWVTHLYFCYFQVTSSFSAKFIFNKTKEVHSVAFDVCVAHYCVCGYMYIYAYIYYISIQFNFLH